MDSTSSSSYRVGVKVSASFIKLKILFGDLRNAGEIPKNFSAFAS
jgi:hypothetical protein